MLRLGLKLLVVSLIFALNPSLWLAKTVTVENPETVLLHVANQSAPASRGSVSSKKAAPVKLALSPSNALPKAVLQEQRLAQFTSTQPISPFQSLVFSITQSYLETLKSGWTFLSPEAYAEAMAHPLRGNNFDRVMAHTRHTTLTLQVYDRHLGKEKPPTTAIAMRPPVMVMPSKAMSKIQSPYANPYFGQPIHLVGGLVNPLLSGTISSPYGPRWGRMHTGTDISAPLGTPFYAAGEGRVLRAEPDGGYGLLIEIQHTPSLRTRYAHCSSFGVFPGMMVRKGQYIGNVGSSGNSTGPHLHFEVLINGFPVNPQQQVARL
jgi:Peptidase family M23